MIAIGAAFALAAAWLGFQRYCVPWHYSPDGRIYLEAGKGARVPRPFHLRVLLPKLCGESTVRWRLASWAGLASAAVGVAWLGQLHGLSASRCVLAAALFLGLPLVTNTSERPVLVDGPALALTAVSAGLVLTGELWWSVIVACIGAAVKEHVPIFAAACVMSPWPLLGLVVPLAIALLRTPAPATHASQDRPLAYAREKQSPRLPYALHVLAPWGLCLAALWAVTPAVAVSCAISYGLLFVASDSTRIYQWAALPVCVAAAGVIPESCLVPAAVAHLWWPWRGLM